jgi:hypothetical protein
MTSISSGPSADLDSTIAALQGGLNALPPEVAIPAIESWQQQLTGTEIANLLGALKTALSGAPTNQSIGALLSELGVQASSAGGAISGPEATKLEELGQLLTQAGNSLS